MALKDLQIRALKATDRIYRKSDEGGLYIEVHPSGSKLWRVKYIHRVDAFERKREVEPRRDRAFACPCGQRCRPRHL
nr:Arm DNA-binding domain-containing protein [Sphingomonas sp. UNC305MFCol5.2]